MEDNNQKILVVCSFTDETVNWKVPSGFDLDKAKLVLHNYEIDSLVLKPYETRVYLW